jgi:hypothetical protein
LVCILAKDEQKQKAIKEKSVEDAASGLARVIGPSITSTPVAKKTTVAAGAGTQPPKVETGKAGAPTGSTTSPGSSTTGKPPPLTGTMTSVPPSTSTSTSTTTSGKSGTSGTQTTPVKKQAPKMVLQPIPPFNPNKLRGPAAATSTIPSPSSGTSREGGLTNAATPEKDKEKDKDVGTSASAATRLNINASSFKPNTGLKPSVCTASTCQWRGVLTSYLQASSSSTSSQKAPDTVRFSPIPLHAKTN